MTKKQNKNSEIIGKIIEQLQLKSHPEGGYYKEVYRCEDLIDKSVLSGRYNGDRNTMTSIYFLLSSDNPSSFHSLRSDEIWYFHQGSPLTLYLLKNGKKEEVIMGNNILNGEVPYFLIEKGVCFAAEINNADDYSLVSCAVSPGFDFNDFSTAEASNLELLYPNERELIYRLTRGSV